MNDEQELKKVGEGDYFGGEFCLDFPFALALALALAFVLVCL